MQYVQQKDAVREVFQDVKITFRLVCCGIIANNVQHKSARAHFAYKQIKYMYIENEY